MTATQMLARARGVRVRCGNHTCFFCGGSCGPTPVTSFLKPTFTDWRNVVCPESSWVCDGCPVAMDEKADLGRAKPQKIRNYSWILTETSATLVEKGAGGRALLRRACADPPSFPLAICIATSGQKQLLYRTPVNRGDDGVLSILLEEERITYRPGDLAARLRCYDVVALAVGRRRLAEGPSVQAAIALHDARGEASFALLDEWRTSWGDPLSRLATFLASTEET